MKATVTLLLILLTLFPLTTFAQDYTGWELPDGAKTRLGKGSINDLAYSPDGTRLAVASTIGIWLYDTATGVEVALLTGHTDYVTSVAFRPDGRTLASGSVDDTIRLWNAGTGGHVRTLTGHTEDVTSVAFSPDGRTLASGSYDNTIRLWNAGSGAPIRTLTEHTGDVTSVAFSPDGSTLASGSSDNTIRLWNAGTGAHIRTLTEHTRGVRSVAFSPDGRTLASGSLDETIRLWNAGTGAPIRTLTGHVHRVTSVAFSPDGSTLASGSLDETIRLWNAGTGAPIRTLTEHTESVYSVAFSPDGSTLASGSYDNTIRLWNAGSGAPIRTLTGHTNTVSSVAFSPDGSTLASGSNDHTIHLWDAATGAHKRTLTGHTAIVNSVAFSPDGRTLASGSWDDTIRLWNAGSGAPVRTLRGHTDSVFSVAFSPDGSTLASGSRDDTIRLWNAGTGAHKRTLTGHTHYASSVAFSPDGSTLASGSYDNTIRLWNADTGAHNRTLTEHTGPVDSVAFSPDGSTLASGSYDDTIRLWDVATGAAIRTFTGHTDSVSSVAFSPDGSTLASGSYDDTIRLWNAGTGAHIRTLTKHIRGVLSVAFSPDGSTLVSGSFDGTVLLWELTPSSTPTPTVRETLAIVIEGTITQPDGTPAAGLEVTITIGNNTGTQVSRADGTYGPVPFLSLLTGTRYRSSDTVEVQVVNQDTGESASKTIQLSDEQVIAKEAIIDLQLTAVRETNVIAITGTITQPDGTPAGAGLAVTITIGDTTQTGVSESGGTYTVTFVNLAGIVARSSDTVEVQVVNEATGESASATVPLSAEQVIAHNAIIDLQLTAKPIVPVAKPVLDVPAGISLIHVPLKVTTVDGEAMPLHSIGDLYEALGGGETVSLLITYNTQTQGWNSYLSSRDRGRVADKPLTDDLGIIASMKAPVSIELDGDPLGVDGSSAITLHPGTNVVGVPLKDSRLTRVSDLFALEGIEGNVPVIIVSDAGAFQLIAHPGDPGDVELRGGQAFIMTAVSMATVDISGDGWYTAPVTAAAPSMALTGIQIEGATPVLAVSGSIRNEVRGLETAGLRVTVKNLSTGAMVTAVTDAELGGYQLTFVALETGRAAEIGDILEISAQSSNPFIGVQPVRHTVTAFDVKRNWIQLAELVAYEIPAKTELLLNYPNPFNPETWIPYQLAHGADVEITIYNTKGAVVRQLNLGHQPAGYYTTRAKAGYWNGRNESGERVASGVYFYHLSAGEYSKTRRLVILK